MGQLQHQLDYFTIVIRLWLVSIDRTAQRQYATGQALAHSELLTDADNQLPFDRRLYSFFVSTSFKIRCSNESTVRTKKLSEQGKLGLVSIYLSGPFNTVGINHTVGISFDFSIDHEYIRAVLNR